MNDKELYELCQQYGRETRKWKNKFVALLPEVYKRRLYKKYGYCSIREFGAKIGGVSYNVIDEALRLAEKFKEMPELLELMSEVGLSKLRIVAGIATIETSKMWAKRVRTMTRAALETLIRDLKKQPEQENENVTIQKYPGIEFRELATPRNAQPQVQNALFDIGADSLKNCNMSNRERFGMDLDPETIFQLQLLKQKFEKDQGEPLCWDDVMKMAAEKVLSVASEREKKASTKEPKTLTKKRKQEIINKQNGKCIHPNCNRPAEHVHHSDRLSVTKKHTNLVALCKSHHQLAHYGYLDEQNGFETLEEPAINPLKFSVDQKMIAHLQQS